MPSLFDGPRWLENNKISAIKNPYYAREDPMVMILIHIECSG
jgi:hypothetical protein